MRSKIDKLPVTWIRFLWARIFGRNPTAEEWRAAGNGSGWPPLTDPVPPTPPPLENGQAPVDLVRAQLREQVPWAQIEGWDCEGVGVNKPQNDPVEERRGAVGYPVMYPVIDPLTGSMRHPDENGIGVIGGRKVPRAGAD